MKIAHIEAGLRSFNMQMPEEINRILTDRVSTVLFCPTQTAVDNLTGEAISSWGTDAQVILSGDVMLDGAIFYKNLSQQLPDLEVASDFVLCTIHRAENTDDPSRLINIISALNEIAQHKQVILPLHPRTKKILEQRDYDITNLTIIDPVGYLNMVWLLNNCTCVMTDSGGLQKEAFFFAKPCITLRDETEWVELVQHSFNVLVGADKEKILEAYHHAEFADDFSIDLYGTGQASEAIVSKLLFNKCND
jgi:UDP-GlcNAc3NAcA epimerase